ncbi:MAG: PASTA domain-containing protein [Clostridia bacterium]|jgi:hypothetical protein|nr:PASTA domain-containing protein [Clostridia bacterium]
MKQIKKAFDELNNETMSDAKKQEIFDHILVKSKAERKTRRNVFAIAAPIAAAAVIAVAVFAVTGFFNPQEQMGEIVIVPEPAQEMMASVADDVDEFAVMSTIVLDLNPKVRFDLDAQGEVLTVQGLDADGELLLAGIDCAGLTLENATIVVVNQLILQDYITAGVIEEEITLEMQSETLGVETLEVMTQTIITAAEHHDIEVEIIADEEEQTLQIVLTAEESEDETVEPQISERMTVQFQIYEEDNSVVGNVSAFTEDSERLITSIDFAGMPFPESVLWAINDLIEKGYIGDGQMDKQMLVTLDTADAQKLGVLKYLTGLMVDEAGLALDIVDLGDDMGFSLVVSDKVTLPRATFTISDILDATVRKSIEELSDMQMEILKIVYTSEQIEWLMTPRYFVVVPDLVGMDVEQAVQMLEQIGVVPVVGKVYSEQLSQLAEGEVYFQDFSAGSVVEKGQRFQVGVVAQNPADVALGEGWEVSTYVQPDKELTATIAAEYDKYITDVESIYVEISNNELSDVTYWDSFILEKEHNGVWYRAVSGEAELEAVQKTLRVGRSMGVRIDVASFGGALDDGHYRILMTVRDEVVSAEFIVAVDGYSDEFLSWYPPLDWLPMEYVMNAVYESKDFVIDDMGVVYHQEKMIEFIDKAGKGIPCMVRVVTFTDGGGVIIEDFTYNGEYYVVERDGSRDVDGDTENVRFNYSYMTIGFANGAEQIRLANSYQKQPINANGEIDYGYVLLSDTSVITQAEVTLTVDERMDADAPMKVFSPDGSAVVSYADGGMVVVYEVKGEQGSYGSGIILPDDNGEAVQVLEMKWTDEHRVVITFGTQLGVYERIAFDVAGEGFVPLTDDEQGAITSIEQDYFTDADRADMQTAFFDEVVSFEFSIGGFGMYNTYVIEDLTLVTTLGETQGADAQPIIVDWTEDKWDAFLIEVAASNVYAWDRTYIDPSAVDGTQWSLKIVSEDDAIVCSGSNMYPDEFAALLAIMTEYFGSEVR